MPRQTRTLKKPVDVNKPVEAADGASRDHEEELSDPTPKGR